MSSFSKSNVSLLKGVSTRGNNILETERLQKKAQAMNANEKSITTLKVKSLKYIRTHQQLISKFTDIAALPGEGCQLRIITQQQINAFTLLLLIHQQHGIKNLHCTSFNYSQDAIDALLSFLNEGCEAVTLVCNDSLRQMMPQRYVYLKEAHARNNGRMRLAVVHNHTKISLIHTHDDKFFVIEGSGNFSKNTKIEQYIFEQCTETYIFHKHWIEHFFSDDYRKMKRDEILK